MPSEFLVDTNSINDHKSRPILEVGVLVIPSGVSFVSTAIFMHDNAAQTLSFLR